MLNECRAESVVLPGEGHPYRSPARMPKGPSIASRALSLSSRLAQHSREDLQEIAERVESLLVEAGYDDLRHYDLERHVFDSFSGVGCTYLIHDADVVMLERVVFPSTYAALDRLRTGELDLLRLYFVEDARFAADALDIFSMRNHLRSAARQEQLKYDVWCAMRGYPYDNKDDVSLEQLSGQMLLRAVNRVHRGGEDVYR